MRTLRDTVWKEALSWEHYGSPRVADNGMCVGVGENVRWRCGVVSSQDASSAASAGERGPRLQPEGTD